MRVLICGGRNFDNAKIVGRAMRFVAEQYGEISCVIEGGARGADYLGKLWAEGQGIPVFECRANWNRYGKRAGHVRNGWMIAHGRPDMVVAFPGGRGTENMMQQAAEAGLPIYMPQDFKSQETPTPSLQGDDSGANPASQDRAGAPSGLSPSVSGKAAHRISQEQLRDGGAPNKTPPSNS